MAKNDFSIFESNNLNKDSLFDKVLSQVEEKNRSKKKKGKEEELDEKTKMFLKQVIKKAKTTIQSETERKIEISNEKNFSLINNGKSYLNKDEEFENRKLENVLKKSNESRKNEELKLQNDITDFKIYSSKTMRENKVPMANFEIQNANDEKLKIEKNLNQNKNKKEEFELERKIFESKKRRKGCSKNKLL